MKTDLTPVYARAYIVVEFRRQDDSKGKVQLTMAQAGRVTMSPSGPGMAEMPASFLAAMDPVAAAPFGLATSHLRFMPKGSTEA